MVDMKFTKIAFLSLISASVLVLAGCDLLGKNYGGTSTKSSPVGTPKQERQSTNTQSQTGEAVTITFSADGISPAQVTVASGSSIKWVNSTSAKIQVASDPHPTHTANPEITNGDFVIEVEPGASSNVVVVKKGTWGIHDHLKPGVRGKVVVE